ncbi:MAG: M48 family metalloprotease [Halioglobus sp.]|nr:M48 family metalloprotease [Halioglobus sp.]
MNLPQGNPRIPEGINASEEHPLREFGQLVLGIGVLLVLFVFTLSLSVKVLVAYVPFSWEARVAPALASAFGDDSKESDARLLALQGLGHGLVASSLAVPVGDASAAEVVPPQAFRFHLMDADMPNAFATLGANIAVTEELFSHVQSENGLAMVMAHEIAHVQLRHPIASASQGIVIQLALAMLLGGSGDSLLGGLLATGGTVTLLSFSRDMEREADARALQILATHYGHLGGADEFFRTMRDGRNEQLWLEFVQTHPNTDKRVAFIEEAMRSAAGQGDLRPLPAALAHGSTEQSNAAPGATAAGAAKATGDDG